LVAIGGVVVVVGLGMVLGGGAFNLISHLSGLERKGSDPYENAQGFWGAIFWRAGLGAAVAGGVLTCVGLVVAR
jgi:hypothetical protein